MENNVAFAASKAEIVRVWNINIVDVYQEMDVHAENFLSRIVVLVIQKI